MLFLPRKIVFAFLLTTGLSAGNLAFSQTTKTTWTLQECLEAGLQNNLQVKQAQINGELARVNLNQARNNALPTLNANSSYGINFGLNNDPTTGILVNQNTRSQNIGISTNMPIFNGFQIRNAVKQNQLNVEATLADVEKARNDISLNIVSAYLQVILGDELVQTARLQLANSQGQAERTGKLFKAGSVPESNVFEANAQIATDEVNLVNAQNQKDIAELNLMQLMNLNPSQEFEVVKLKINDPDELLVSFDPNQVYEGAQTRLPEAKSADLRVSSALIGIKSARGAYLPQLGIGGSFNTSYFNLNRIRILNTGQEQTGTQFIGLVNGDENQRVFSSVTFRNPVTEPYTYFTQLQDNRGGGVFVSLNIPIFNGFSARNGVQRAEVNHQNAILNAEISRNQLRQTIQQSYADAVAAQKRFIATKRQLAALELTYKNAEIRFNNGLLNPTDYNVARNNFTRAQSDLIQAKYQYTFRLKILDFYQGKPLAL